MNILLIGSGSIGKRHATNLLEQIADAKFYILKHQRQSDPFAESISAEIIHSWNDVPSNIDLAILANPSACHANHIEKIIENRIPAYLEKPLVTTRADLNRIRSVLSNDDYQQPTMMGCNLRYLPSIQKIKASLERGDIGQCCRALFEVGQYLPLWREGQDYRASYSANPDLGGGVIFDLSHELDLTRFILGDLEVMSSQTGHLSHLEIKSEDTAVIHLARPQGPFVSVHLDYVSRVTTRNIKLVGDQGTLIWDLPKQKLILEKPNETIVLAENAEEFNVKHTYKTAMNELLQCIRDGTQTSQSIHEGMRTTELLLQCKGM